MDPAPTSTLATSLLSKPTRADARNGCPFSIAVLYDNFAGVTTDERGNVYVTGITESSSNFFERVTIKHSRDGRGIWTNRFDSGQSNFTGGANIAADKQGNVAIVFHTLTNDVLAKLSAAGVLEWQRWLPTPSDVFYSPIYQVRFDSKGRVLVCGRSLNSELDVDQARVMQFSPDGELLWARTGLVWTQTEFRYVRRD